MAALDHPPHYFSAPFPADRIYEHGACGQMGLTIPERDDLFFPGRGKSTQPAKDICAGCPVRVDCLEYALAAKIEFGIYGGTSYRERKKIRRERLAAELAAAHDEAAA
jgi:hypothetical protein